MRLSAVLGMILAGIGLVAAQPQALTAGEMASALRAENFSIPSPGEIFSAMDAVARPSWTQWTKNEPPPALDDRERIALFLGKLVADGYVAVEAQDAQAVKNIGKDILALAKKLNVSQSVLARAG
ncbi:MAG: hypothetical protein N2322_06030, partial [Terrimicrobiaceae bacterium]|nr:hypothetical protein [Terrimicrobiaceae bacterium]